MGSAMNDEVDRELVECDFMLRELKKILEGSINRMKAYHYGKRRDEEFEPGDLVFLKLRPFRQRTTAQRAATKIGVRYYGTYKILAKIGKVAYRLELPGDSHIHPIIHVSQLKRSLGEAQLAKDKLPAVAPDGKFRSRLFNPLSGPFPVQ
ncbi:Unknown protein [Striga hermonthica]|uniref:Tf2-1-like SH3-like domain-containing protein n=1 Tax=Striga hermonthica TaxID=68872 RepID=A0A9N7MZT0_STRHE|nr:Unknown protein [Striga hermonthica]